MRRWFVAAAIAAACVGAGSAAAQEAGIPVGTKAPAVTVDDLDGKPVDLGEYLGRKPVLLEYWATWCEVCEALMPRVRAAHEKFGKQVEFFGVNVTVNQTPDRVRRWVAEHRPPFRTLYDDKGASTRAYKAPATSYVVIVDRTGKVAYTGTGSEQDLDAALRAVTAQ
jgi:cytochrome c biogenesis protein CcmG, thiol:disulfide interchange protein DsbE